MSSQRRARSAGRAGADVDSAPVGDGEGPDEVVDQEPVVDAEVVPDDAGERGEVVDGEVVDGDRPAKASGGNAEAEATAGEVEPEAPAADPLADALRERDEYLALAQRARADFENFRKRAAAQAAEAEGRGRATLARGLLPAIDNLQRALAAAGIDPAAPDASEDGLAKGVALVYGELRAALERAGVIAFDPTGERFDPTVHEAISTTPAAGADPGIVIETLELGYRVDQQVIRPARVVVSG